MVCPFFWPVTLFYFPAGCLEEIHLFKENKCFTFPIFLPAEIAVRFGSGPSCCCGGDIFHEPQKKGPPYPVETWFCRCQLAELGLLLCTGPGHKVSSPPASGIALHDANNTIFINSYQQSYFMFKCLYFWFFSHSQARSEKAKIPTKVHWQIWEIKFTCENMAETSTTLWAFGWRVSLKEYLVAVLSALFFNFSSFLSKTSPYFMVLKVGHSAAFIPPHRKMQMQQPRPTPFLAPAPVCSNMIFHRMKTGLQDKKRQLADFPHFFSKRQEVENEVILIQTDTMANLSKVNSPNILLRKTNWANLVSSFCSSSRGGQVDEAQISPT